MDYGAPTIDQTERWNQYDANGEEWYVSSGSRYKHCYDDYWNWCEQMKQKHPDMPFEEWLKLSDEQWALCEQKVKRAKEEFRRRVREQYKQRAEREKIDPVELERVQLFWIFVLLLMISCVLLAVL